ncbi:hypothetical protein PHSC3_001278 [Chlamydiales bacterium STE3]|nr:hypothetical protein PHSC3_001278 [Chlamydiales bacterium STE3]
MQKKHLSPLIARLLSVAILLFILTLSFLFSLLLLPVVLFVVCFVATCFLILFVLGKFLKRKKSRTKNFEESEPFYTTTIEIEPEITSHEPINDDRSKR